MARIQPGQAGGKNVCAFLDMIAHSEGTAGHGDDGYNVLVGGGLFHGYDDHPRQLIAIPRLGIKSTAAGRYQLLAHYFDDYANLLGLDDFSPINQDRIAIQQIKESKAFNLVKAGQFDTAVKLCAHIWASLPGAGYNQHEQPIKTEQQFYTAAGGKIGETA